MAEPNQEYFEYMGSLFALEIEGVEIARFTGVSGLGYTAEVVEFPDTLEDGSIVVRKRPGRVSFNDITLKRGLSADNALVEWYQSVLEGAVERQNGSIVLYGTSGDEVGRWNFERAWISSWSASDMDAGSDEVVVEEITIVHENLYRAD